MAKACAVRAVVQRVESAAVDVAGERVGAIGRGLLALVAAGAGDDQADAAWLAGKVARLRVFADEEGRMNRALADVGGAVLAVSQFTLYGDVSRGNRPSFVAAAPPEEGERLVEAFVAALREEGVPVETGRFGAHMRVSLVNDGPVTLVIDSP
jgi:D-tyrosyl-tRNA(Tyr) deacylase